MTSRPMHGVPTPRQTAAPGEAIRQGSPEARAPAFLTDPHRRLLLFGGKGGVGKTTIAAAAALHWARRSEGDVLVVSTDPAHSLTDAFGQTIGDRITAVSEEPGLFALALDARTRMDAFKNRYGSTLGTIVERGTYFDDDDVRRFLELSLPGLDEVIAVLEISEIMKEDRYRKVILDTAPTGHTLRLLEMPDLLTRWLHALDLMLVKHRYIQSVFGGRRRDETDVFMERIGGDLALLRALLSDPLSTEFVAVTVPEVMGVRETWRLLDGLDAMGIPARTVIVNRVARAAAAEDCAFCAERRLAQQPALRELAARLGAPAAAAGATGTGTAPRRGTEAIRLPLLPHQIHGHARLDELAGLLRDARPLRDAAAPDAAEAATLRPPAGAGAVERLTGQPSWSGAGEPRGGRMVLDRGFVLVGGKGGVGKTTVAAAVAVHLAGKAAADGVDEDRRVLLLSADPAHSLSDCLDQELGGAITAVEGVPRLDALELEPATLLDELTRLYSSEGREAFAAFGGGGDMNLAFDAEALRELVSLAPPGLDELAALLRLMDLVQEGRYDAYVLDLAPTGHALRLLETPGLVREWFTALFAIMLRYRSVFSLATAGELLRLKSKQLREIQRILVDPARCRLIAVTIPEAMAVQETRRLLDGLAGLSVQCDWVIANMVTAPSACPFCAAVYAEQRPQLEAIGALGPSCVHLPALPGEPRGPGALELVARLLCD